MNKFDDLMSKTFKKCYSESISVCVLCNEIKIRSTRNVSVWHRCPRQGPSSTTCRYLAKHEVEKKDKSIFFFFFKYQKEYIFWRWKRAITPIIMGWFYPIWNLTSILWLYTCVLNLNSIHYCFQKISTETIFQLWKRAVTPSIIGGF